MGYEGIVQFICDSYVRKIRGIRQLLRPIRESEGEFAREDVDQRLSDAQAGHRLECENDFRRLAIALSEAIIKQRIWDEAFDDVAGDLGRSQGFDSGVGYCVQGGC